MKRLHVAPPPTTLRGESQQVMDLSLVPLDQLVLGGFVHVVLADAGKDLQGCLMQWQQIAVLRTSSGTLSRRVDSCRRIKNVQRAPCRGVI